MAPDSRSGRGSSRRPGQDVPGRILPWSLIGVGVLLATIGGFMGSTLGVEARGPGLNAVESFYRPPIGMPLVVAGLGALSAGVVLEIVHLLVYLFRSRAGPPPAS